MDSGMIAKIEKAMIYAQEPERITFEKFKVSFQGDHKQHEISYNEGNWSCDCKFFESRGICSHIMTMERILLGSVQPAEIIPMPA